MTLSSMFIYLPQRRHYSFKNFRIKELVKKKKKAQPEEGTVLAYKWYSLALMLPFQVPEGNTMHTPIQKGIILHTV